MRHISLHECTRSLKYFAKYKLYLDLPKMWIFNFSDSFFDDQLNLENQNRFDPMTKEKKTGSSSFGTSKNNFIGGLKFVSININSIRGKKLELLAFLDFQQPHIVAIQETKLDSSIATSELFPESCPYNIYRKDRNLHGGDCYLFTMIFHICPPRNWKTTRSHFRLKCLQTKLLIMWQVGTGNLVVLVKTFNCSEISLTMTGTKIKVKTPIGSRFRGFQL